MRSAVLQEDVAAAQPEGFGDGLGQGVGVGEVNVFGVGEVAEFAGDVPEPPGGAFAEQDVEELDQAGVPADDAGDEYAVDGVEVTQGGQAQVEAALFGRGERGQVQAQQPVARVGDGVAAGGEDPAGLCVIEQGGEEFREPRIGEGAGVGGEVLFEVVEQHNQPL